MHCGDMVVKLLNFLPEVVTWWTLKIICTFGSSEYAVRVTGLVRFYRATLC